MLPSCLVLREKPSCSEVHLMLFLPPIPPSCLYFQASTGSGILHVLSARSETSIARPCVEYCAVLLDDKQRIFFWNTSVSTLLLSYWTSSCFCRLQCRRLSHQLTGKVWHHVMQKRLWHLLNAARCHTALILTAKCSYHWSIAFHARRNKQDATPNAKTLMSVHMCMMKAHGSYK